MLYLFDIDGTLIRSFLREKGAKFETGTKEPVDLYDRIEVLPGRVERLRELCEEGNQIALVTNQAGIAFGYQTLQQIASKMTGVMAAMELGTTWICTEPNGGCDSNGFLIHRPAHERPRCYMSLGHPKAKVERYLSDTDWRKPGGGMILRAIEDYDSETHKTVYVGDLESDEGAAQDAGTWFCWADDFFGEDDPLVRWMGPTAAERRAARDG